MANRRTAVLLDPYPLWLHGVATHLESLGWEILAATTSPEQALSCIEERAPNVAIVAFGEREGGLGGVEFLRLVSARAPKTRAIVVSPSDDLAIIDKAFAAGAAAYVVRTAEREDLEAALRQAFDQSVFLTGVRAGRREWEADVGMTERELEILRLVAAGMSNADVGRALWLSEPTVKVHLSRIFRKLGVANRTEASRWAQVNGLLEAPGRRGSS